MKKIYYDFHIHSCLSPCGDIEMTPCNIVGMAALKGLDVIALTDHNSCKNCAAAVQAAKGSTLRVIPGMELCTSEEIHVVCLFPGVDSAMEFDRYVYERLPDFENSPDIFGRQVIMDCDDNEAGEERKLLINACDISINDVSGLVSGFGGLAFPAHIEKSSSSILSSLGYFPPECNFAAYEMHDPARLAAVLQGNPVLNGMMMLKNSDAHYLENINEAENLLDEAIVKLNPDIFGGIF